MHKSLVIFAISTCAVAHLSRLPGPWENTYLVPSPQADTCSTAFTLGGYTFNLTSLSLPTGGYIANNTLDSHYYCINLCRNVNSDRNCICNACGGSEYPATQITDTTSAVGSPAVETCVAYLGNLDKTSWDLLEPLKPGGDPAGVSLTYGDGQSGKSTVINFYCDPTQTSITIPQFQGSQGLVYTFNWYNAAACPKK